MTISWLREIIDDQSERMFLEQEQNQLAKQLEGCVGVNQDAQTEI